MNTQAEYKEIWIGLANIKIDRALSSIEDADYAYVTAVGLAKGKGNFKQRVAEKLSSLNFKLLKLEQAERLSERIKKFKIEDSILQLAQDIINSDEEVKFSTFHTYD